MCGGTRRAVWGRHMNASAHIREKKEVGRKAYKRNGIAEPQELKQVRRYVRARGGRRHGGGTRQQRSPIPPFAAAEGSTSMFAMPRRLPRQPQRTTVANNTPVQRPSASAGTTNAAGKRSRHHVTVAGRWSRNQLSPAFVHVTLRSIRKE